MRTRMDAGLAAILTTLDSIDTDDMTSPTDKAGWTVLDHVVHLAAWAEGMAALLRRQPRWEAMGIADHDPALAPKDTPIDYEAMNAAIRDRNQGTSPDEARARLVAAHQAVADAVDAITEDDLDLTLGRYVAPFTEDRGAPVGAYVIGNTYEHYEEHAPWILAIVGR